MALFRSIITSLARAGVWFGMIMYIQATGISVHNFLTGNGRTILHHHDFKVLICLPSKAVQQFIHLIGTIINRYNK